MMQCQKCHKEITLDVQGFCVSCWSASHPADPGCNIWSWVDKKPKKKKKQRLKK